MIFLFWLSYFSHLSFFWDHCSIMMQDTKKCQGLNITFLDYLLSGWPIFRKESAEKCLSSIKIPFPTLEEGFSAGNCPLLPHPFGTGTVASCFEQLSVGHWATAVLDEELLPSLTDQLVYLDLFLTFSLQPRDLVERLHSPAVFSSIFWCCFQGLVQLVVQYPGKTELKVNWQMAFPGGCWKESCTVSR